MLRVDINQIATKTCSMLKNDDHNKRSEAIKYYITALKRGGRFQNIAQDDIDWAVDLYKAKDNKMLDLFIESKVELAQIMRYLVAESDIEFSQMVELDRRMELEELARLAKASIRPESKSNTPTKPAYFEQKQSGAIEERRKLIRAFLEKYLVHKNEKLGVYFENVYRNEEMKDGHLEYEHAVDTFGPGGFTYKCYPAIIFSEVLKLDYGTEFEPFCLEMNKVAGLEDYQWLGGLREVKPEQLDTVVDFLAKSKFALRKAVTDKSAPVGIDAQRLKEFQTNKAIEGGKVAVFVNKNNEVSYKKLR